MKWVKKNWAWIVAGIFFGFSGAYAVHSLSERLAEENTRMYQLQWAGHAPVTIQGADSILWNYCGGSFTDVNGKRYMCVHDIEMARIE